MSATVFDALQETSGRRWGSILVTYASSDDDAVLAHAVALAQAHHARLAIAVPVARSAPFASLAFIDLIGVQGELERGAQRLAARAAGLVPDDVSLVIRCVASEHAQRLEREIAAGAWDLCVASQRSTRGLWRGGGLERLMLRSARRGGVATVLAPVSGV